MLATLTNPPGFTQNALNTFTAPAGTTLDPNTRYWVTVNEETAAASRLFFRWTTATGQSGASGWTIADGRITRSGTSWSSSTNSLVMAVEGSVNPASSDTSVGPLGLYWTASSGSDDRHPDLVGMNTLRGTCTGTASFRVLWSGPGRSENFRPNPPALEWDAQVTATGNASNVHYWFAHPTGSTDFVDMYGTVDLAGTGRLTIRIRGRFNGQGWGAWSPPASLLCYSE